MTTITPEEIVQFRSQLEGYPEAIAALDVVQECDGYVDDALTLLVMRETGKEPDRGLNEWLQKSRKVVCQEEYKEALASGMIAPVIEPISMSLGIPPGIATVIAILVFKLGVKKFCETASPAS